MIAKNKINRIILKKEYFLLAIIILIAIFLRSYRFHDFLTFQSDQARDAIVASQFVQGGFLKIPLLGPQASGSDLMLGPVFYYIQSFFVLFFGNSPSVLALPDLLFSILFVVILYFFLRMYFFKTASLTLTAIASASLFLIVYGRFAWNPNSLPFFSLLSVMGLLKFNWNGIKKPGWLYVSIASFCVGSQLHFIFFLVAPAIIIFYLFFQRKLLKIKNYLICISIIFLIYSPVIWSEIKTGGQNSDAFFETIVSKGSRDKKDNILEKAFRAYEGIPRAYWSVLTSDESGSTVTVNGFKINCNDKCKSGLPFFFFQNIIFILAIFSAYKAWKQEDNKDRRKFIYINLLWLVSFYIILIPIANKVAPRFYLSSIPPLFVLMGMTWNELSRITKIKLNFIILAIGSVLILSNLSIVYIYFYQHSHIDQPSLFDTKGSDFHDDQKITLDQLEMATNYIAENMHSETPVKIVADNNYAHSLFYLLRYRKKIPSCYVKYSDFNSQKTGNFFLVKKTSADESALKGFEKFFILKETRIIGNLIISDFSSKANSSELENCITL